ncbi:hypothetical protein MNBD_GAMMA10-2315, partial [hydrothermal vent metagenome]
QLQLQDTARSMRNWQRKEALKIEQASLQQLKKSGMDVYEITTEKRKDFVQSLPPWHKLLPASLSGDEKTDLLSLAD